MKTIRKLVFIQLKHLLSVNTAGGKKKRKTSSVWVMLAFIAGIALYIGATYSFAIGGVFHQFGVLDLLFVVMSAMGTLAATLITIQGVTGLVYQAKDMPFLLSLPLRSQTVLMAKVMAVYGEAFVLNFFLLAPAFITYIRLDTLAPISYLLFLIVILLLPFLATTLALILGYLFSLLQTKTKSSPVITNSLALAGTLIILFLTFRVQSMFLNEALNPLAVRTSLSTYARPFYWVRDILVDTNLMSLVWLALLSLVPLAILIRLLSTNYLHVISGLSARQKSSDYRGPSTQQSPIAALLRKEFKQYFGSSIYFINTIIGPLMLIGGPIYLLLKRDMIAQLEPVLQSVDIPISVIVVGAIVGLISFNNTTAPSISLEGSRLWILKSLPIRTWDIFQAKLLLNMILFFPAIVIAGFVANILFDFSLMERILVIVIPVLSSLASAMIGLVANLFYPKLDAPSDAAVVKNSASVLIGSLGYMVITAALLGLLFGLREVLGGAILYVLLAVYLILNVILYRYLRTGGTKRFKAII